MPNEFSAPGDYKDQNGKRSGKDRRRKDQGRNSDDDDREIVPRPGQKDRRNQKNYRDLLNRDDDD